MHLPLLLAEGRGGGAGLWSPMGVLLDPQCEFKLSTPQAASGAPNPPKLMALLDLGCGSKTPGDTRDGGGCSKPDSPGSAGPHPIS